MVSYYHKHMNGNEEGRNLKRLPHENPDKSTQFSFPACVETGSCWVSECLDCRQEL